MNVYKHLASPEPAVVSDRIAKSGLKIRNLQPTLTVRFSLTRIYRSPIGWAAASCFRRMLPFMPWAEMEFPPRPI